MEALEKWHDFYILVGTAAATLLALLFVAVSLGTGFLGRGEREAATRAFFSPVVVHFSAAFLLSAVALIPAHRIAFFVVIVAVCGICGFAVSLFTTIQLFRHDWTKYKQDHLAYGLLPVVSYGAFVAAAVMMWAESERAIDILAAGLLLLLLVNVRNAYDLTLSMVRHHAERERQ